MTTLLTILACHNMKTTGVSNNSVTVINPATEAAGKNSVSGWVWWGDWEQFHTCLFSTLLSIFSMKTRNSWPDSQNLPTSKTKGGYLLCLCSGQFLGREQYFPVEFTGCLATQQSQKLVAWSLMLALAELHNAFLIFFCSNPFTVSMGHNHDNQY